MTIIVLLFNYFTLKKIAEIASKGNLDSVKVSGIASLAIISIPADAFIIIKALEVLGGK